MKAKKGCYWLLVKTSAHKGAGQQQVPSAIINKTILALSEARTIDQTSWHGPQGHQNSALIQNERKHKTYSSGFDKMRAYILISQMEVSILDEAVRERQRGFRSKRNTTGLIPPVYVGAWSVIRLKASHWFDRLSGCYSGVHGEINTTFGLFSAAVPANRFSLSTDVFVTAGYFWRTVVRVQRLRMKCFIFRTALRYWFWDNMSQMGMRT
ncbi:hypothetical protein CLF_103760 [Clonorchis sinensis]|uniref:Uncharacterized protein n=1 Tax=Clonorchis sinensis TaxID=79923 RepID=G7YAB8_CLOSI|nr:hypothetical protein CLF_103760 [Clonorchis sinensis]